ncbi:carbohydrate ABC transporter permease [Clostridium sp.]|uniref:carbohydrate ABC transporter permease n=1 Tax=Clostridium sp. TaxID=1506 RepID=UPI003D6CC253
MNSGIKIKFKEKVILYTILIVLLIVSVGPFLWLLSTALKSSTENLFKFPPDLLPRHPTLESMKSVFKTIPFMTYLINSVIIALVQVVLNVVLACLAAYPLARMKFKGKDIIFTGILSTMMIPIQVTMIPIFVLISKIGLKNSYPGVILPFAVTAFGIFLIRQAFLTIPVSIEEAAYIDGCNAFQIWYKILLPLIKPFIATLAIFTFVNSWGDFLWPLLVLSDKSKYTLPLGVMDLQGTFATDWRLIAAGAVLSMIPIIIFFIATQKYFMEGATAGGVKE